MKNIKKGIFKKEREGKAASHILEKHHTLSFQFKAYWRREEGIFLFFRRSRQNSGAEANRTRGREFEKDSGR